MLDTDTISTSHGINLPRHEPVEHAQDISPVYVSAITEGKILHGLAKRPAAHRVGYFIRAALAMIEGLAVEFRCGLGVRFFCERNESLG